MEEPNTNEEFIYSLIIDELEEQLSPEKRQLLDDWRNVDPSNESTYQEFLRIQQNMNKLYEKQAYTPEESWDVLNEKLDQQRPVIQLQGKKLMVWLSIAASLLLMLSLGAYLFNQSKYIVISNNEQRSVSHVFLPDGTQLSLNTGASLRYNSKGFVKNRRLELLEGEVFITVKHNVTSPFIVDIAGVEARDIGTSFNILKGKQDVTLSVEEGEVALENIADKKSIRLTAGTTGYYTALTREFTKGATKDVNYKAWKDKDFVFTESPLKDVVQQLGKAYHTSITVEGIDLQSKKLTAHLRYQTPDSALNVIAATLQCKLENSEGRYILSDR